MFPLVHGILSGQGGPDPLIWAEPQVVLNYSVDHSIQQESWGITSVALKSPGYATASYENGGQWSKAILSDQGINLEQLGVSGNMYGDASSSFIDKEFFIQRSNSSFQREWIVDGMGGFTFGSAFYYPVLIETPTGDIVYQSYRANSTQRGRVSLWSSQDNSRTVIYEQSDESGNSYPPISVSASADKIFIFNGWGTGLDKANTLDIIDYQGNFISSHVMSDLLNINYYPVYNGSDHVFMVSWRSSSTDNVYISPFNLRTKNFDYINGIINYTNDLNNGYRSRDMTALAIGQDLGLLVASPTRMTFYVINMAETRPTYTSMSDVSNAWFGS